MILIDNINFLREQFPAVWENIKDISDNGLSTVAQVFPAKSGVPTLMWTAQGRSVYLHSKYDPVQEAERLISKYEDARDYDHVMFYGVGLGYHIEAFMKKYPHLSFSLYEPSKIIFSQFLSHRSLNLLPAKKLKNIYLEMNSTDISNNLNDFMKVINSQKVLLVILPSYERVFKEEYEHFTTLFRQLISDRRFSLNTNVAFEKRWIINSLLNLPETVTTPNAFYDLNQECFLNKPALLVAAGPSLQEDIEEVRYIKENGLAYIFSVGSAINVLLAHGIYPDFACTYDPSHFNQKVFEKVVKEGISTIPLIFGSSVGYETLTAYPGPKLHMLTSQDTVAPFFLRREDISDLETVQDAPSIAVITLQLLHKLGCNPVFLAGQNLAYKDNKSYSQGIEYYSGIVGEQELKRAITVEDVYGNEVYTSETFNKMRKNMEMLISLYTNQQIINTTKGGAKIAGTTFIPLEKVIKEMLVERVVRDNWLQKKYNYDMEYLAGQLTVMDTEYKNIFKIIKSIINIFKEMNNLITTNNKQQLEKTFPKLDKAFTKIRENKFYELFLMPMNRVQFELLTSQIANIRFEKNQFYKARKVTQYFGKYIYLCKKDLELITPLWKNVHGTMLQKIESCRVNNGKK
ncbi:motility associated factor glycosyltransferase family protein [Desulfoscipio geothermicus]|uniref:Uncharacterized conserved protein n=1 Tax=Desulfoscipio geothermicus DSM 3669 TaxID=1121426 RepID=A0A1I6CUV0_9FIRM|nr:6-hydroxymethylpterin diphosphokinase MptE-like protein [Desulfoscipio geothermicus]SFQ96887.1 Uncharacterized conserved protein [Desulfoscipio geothermicus DSM 3669]